MDFRILGSILLIVGTSVGAGMLALPIATAMMGFWGALCLLIICWCLMTVGAFLLLEVNLWMPMNSNLNTMARITIGPIGQILSWLSVLLLFNALLCAYIGGGSDLFHALLIHAGVTIPMWMAAILFTMVFGSVVYLGIRTVDYVNRGLMLVKFIAYFLLVFLLMPFISQANIQAGQFSKISNAAAIMVTVTSFGYAVIVPSLRVYLAGNVAKLKKAILIGSLIPLLCYIAWDLVIMGVLPLEGENGLMRIQQANRSTSELVSSLRQVVDYPAINFFTGLFTSICVLTSFLGVALCLADFWADALQVEKRGYGNLFITMLTFLPALIIVLFMPGIFVEALQYAGINCVFLLVLLPAWMALKGRKKFTMLSRYRMPGGNILLIALILIALVLMMKGLVHEI